MDAIALSAAEVRLAGGRRILGPIDLRVARGERWAVLGPNGSGKTTLLTLAGAIRHPSSGRVEVLGERLGRTDVRALRARIGHIGHSVADRMPQLLPVDQVVLTGKASTLVPWMQGFDATDRAEAGRRLEQVGCAELGAQAFGDCSQGERQRVLIARALFGRRELLLLDEPAAGLDLPGREQLLAAMEAVAGESSQPTSVLVTHHVEEIPPSTTHAALLRGGRTVAAGPVELVVVSEQLSACFGMPISVWRNGARWNAAT